MHGQRRCFNAGLAAAHSQHLTPSRAVTHHVMDAVDVIVGSPQALPKPLEAMLFQHNGTGMPPELPACGVPLHIERRNVQSLIELSTFPYGDQFSSCFG